MMQIMEMSTLHVQQVAAMEKRCFGDPWSERSIASELSNPLSLWLVCMDGDVLVGYVGSQTVLGDADMMNLAVLPEYRKQGVGESLVNGLIAALQARGAQSLSLEVRLSNLPAIGLYKKLGFQQVGVRPRYYRNPREDAYILRKEWGI